MLLVDDDEAEAARPARRPPSAVPRRSAPGRAQPHPLVVALAGAQPRVRDGDDVAEALDEAADGLRRQPDLGHEHDRAAVLRQRRLGGAQVDLGLAGSGHAVHEQRLVAPRRDRGLDLGEGAPLVSGELEPAAGRARRRRARGSGPPRGDEPHEPARLEAAQHAVIGARLRDGGLAERREPLEQLALADVRRTPAAGAARPASVSSATRRASPCTPEPAPGGSTSDSARPASSSTRARSSRRARRDRPGAPAHRATRRQQPLRGDVAAVCERDDDAEQVTAGQTARPGSSQCRCCRASRRGGGIERPRSARALVSGRPGDRGHRAMLVAVEDTLTRATAPCARTSQAPRRTA